MDEEKTVLVQLQTATGNRNRPVTFTGDSLELITATKERFKDVLQDGLGSDVYLQILDKSWGEEMFIDTRDWQGIMHMRNPHPMGNSLIENV